jgi:hypothetical protein
MYVTAKEGDRKGDETEGKNVAHKQDDCSGYGKL